MTRDLVLAGWRRTAPQDGLGLLLRDTDWEFYQDIDIKVAAGGGLRAVVMGYRLRVMVTYSCYDGNGVSSITLWKGDLVQPWGRRGKGKQQDLQSDNYQDIAFVHSLLQEHGERGRPNDAKLGGSVE